MSRFKRYTDKQYHTGHDETRQVKGVNVLLCRSAQVIAEPRQYTPITRRLDLLTNTLAKSEMRQVSDLLTNTLAKSEMRQVSDLLTNTPAKSEMRQVSDLLTK